MKVVIVVKPAEYSKQMNRSQSIEFAAEMLKKLITAVPIVLSVEVTASGKENKRYGFDLKICFNTKDCISIAVEVNNNGEIKYVRKAIETLKGSLKKGEYGVVAAPFISKDAVLLCEQNGISFFDFSGNCLLAFSNIYIRTEGKRNKFTEKKENKNLLVRSSVKSGTVLREMLNEPEKQWQVQELAKATKTSIGMVSNIKKFLLAKEWCVEENGRFALRNIAGLLKVWSEEYQKSKEMAYEFYSIDSVAQIEKQMFELYNKSGVVCCLASFSAAVRYKPTVTYNKAYAYVAQRDFDEAVSFMNLKPVETGGNVELIIPYDECVLIHSKKKKDAFITSPTQTVLDLFSKKARGEEAALEIIEKEFGTYA